MQPLISFARRPLISFAHPCCRFEERAAASASTSTRRAVAAVAGEFSLIVN
jgi:hypothetical protein